MNDKAYVSCMRASEESLIPAELVVCDVCKEDCWIGLALYPRVRSGELTCVCLECTAAVVGLSGPDPLEFMLHPAQMDELRELGLLEEAQRTIARLNRDTRQ
jgi:hypothetical protein